jgi:type II secretory pathway predicted ATPase ExeA
VGFGLATAPFARTDEDAFFFPGDQHLRALEFMGHSLWTNARLGVVTAEHGCGKSLLIHRLLKDLDERIVAAAVHQETISAREFLQDILRQFGFSADEDDKTDRRRCLERFMSHQASMGRICLLVVENPQAMHPSVLEELRSTRRRGSRRHARVEGAAARSAFL